MSEGDGEVKCQNPSISPNINKTVNSLFPSDRPTQLSPWHRTRRWHDRRQRRTLDDPGGRGVGGAGQRADAGGQPAVECGAQGKAEAKEG